MITSRVPQALVDRLDEWAADEGRKRANAIERLLTLALDEQDKGQRRVTRGAGK